MRLKHRGGGVGVTQVEALGDDARIAVDGGLDHDQISHRIQSAGIQCRENTIRRALLFTQSTLEHAEILHRIRIVHPKAFGDQLQELADVLHDGIPSNRCAEAKLNGILPSLTPLLEGVLVAQPDQLLGVVDDAHGHRRNGAVLPKRLGAARAHLHREHLVVRTDAGIRPNGPDVVGKQRTKALVIAQVIASHLPEGQELGEVLNLRLRRHVQDERGVHEVVDVLLHAVEARGNTNTIGQTEVRPGIEPHGELARFPAAAHGVVAEEHREDGREFHHHPRHEHRVLGPEGVDGHLRRRRETGLMNRTLLVQHLQQLRDGLLDDAVALQLDPVLGTRVPNVPEGVPSTTQDCPTAVVREISHGSEHHPGLAIQHAKRRRCTPDPLGLAGERVMRQLLCGALHARQREVLELAAGPRVDLLQDLQGQVVVCSRVIPTHQLALKLHASRDRPTARGNLRAVEVLQHHHTNLLPQASITSNVHIHLPGLPGYLCVPEPGQMKSVFLCYPCSTASQTFFPPHFPPGRAQRKTIFLRYQIDENCRLPHLQKTKSPPCGGDIFAIL